jgi:hypothetical protein
MFLDLPYDLQEYIYQKLGPKQRLKMRLVLPKDTKLWNAERDRKLLMLKKYIKKRKSDIQTKQKCLNQKVISYINKYKSDSYVKRYYVDFKCDESGTSQGLVFDIRNKRVKKEDTYTSHELSCIDSVEVRNAIVQTDIQTFSNLIDNPTLHTFIIKLLSDYDFRGFMFGLVNYKNEELFKHILHSHFNGKETLYQSIQQGIEYLSDIRIASIFVNCTSSLKILTDNIKLSQETLNTLLDKSIENFDIEPTMLLMRIVNPF